MLRRSASVDGRLERKAGDGTGKKQSVRFTGPTAKPRRQLASRAIPVIRNSSTFVDQKPSRQLSGGVRVLAKSNDTHGNPAASIITSFSETKFPNTLRKSKSMYSQSTLMTPTYYGSYTEPVSIQHAPEVSLVLPVQPREDEQLQFSIRRSLRAPKSMSYLDYRMGQAVGETVDVKADGLLGPVKEASSSKGGSSSFHRLKSHSSMFFRGKHRRLESSMETSRSCRNSSDHSAALSSVFSGGNNLTISDKSSGIRFTARRVSKSVKHKLSKLFGRPKSTNASVNETGAANVLHDTDSESYCGHPANGSPSVEEASISRVTSHIPSLHAVPSYQQMRSRQGSLESVQYEEHTDLDQKSRITSWTNSTVNTVASYEEDDERDFQRLSVIKENGMHVPSSSRTGPREDSAHGAAHSARGPNMVIDSQRVYSALMKKLKSEASTSGDGSPKPCHRSKLVSLKTVPPRQSSLDRAEAWSPRTVRDIGTDEDDVFEDSREFASIRVPSSSLGNRPEALCGDGMNRSASYKACPHPIAGDGKGVSPYCPASIPESASKKSRVQAGRSSTFSSSPSSFLFRTRSPYRRALQRSIQEHQDTGHTHALDTRYLSTLSALTLPTRCPSTLGSERDVRLTYAESFYSFASEDLTVCHAPDVAADPIMEEGAEEDVEDAQKSSTVHSLETPLEDRDISSASSVEWKTWLSSHVSKLEDLHITTASPGLEAAIGFGTSAGHVRESAEIESPADVSKATGNYTTQDVSPREEHANSSNTPTIEILTRPGDTDEAPPVIFEDPENASKDLEKDDAEDGSPLAPPPIPNRNVLRTVTSLPNVDNEAAISSSVKRRKNITHRRSMNNIPTWVPLIQDGTHEKRRDQENERRDAPSSKNSTPGGRAAVTREECLNAKTGSPYKSKTKTVTVPQTPVGHFIGPGPANVPDTSKSEWDAQVRGSRRMVDLFLSSRRKAIEGPMSRNGSENFSGAFL
ncbi:hypothetical protein E4U57_000205 [Claviceps arundinis]|uniref:Uncharacterized protein n=1 Tax=Claviceps arundinis TaxID=1623583 RepID=A0ABQ7PDV5_9HYPO|nr:hypothetical protein E4U57_000205 [Claviceps arundinis]